ncbi:MAG TPA: GNAT family N-acetyltransferase [Rubrobacter sp.]
MGSTVDIRRALPGDSGALTHIAFAAKRHWGYPESWIQYWNESLTITPEFVRNNEVYAAFSGSELLAFYALTGKGRTVELEHLWVSPGWIGKGMGRVLFEHAMREAASGGADAVEIEADPNAEGFYRRMGARRIGENVYEIDGHERVLPLMVVEIGTGPHSR